MFPPPRQSWSATCSGSETVARHDKPRQLTRSSRTVVRRQIPLPCAAHDPHRLPDRARQHDPLHSTASSQHLAMAAGAICLVAETAMGPHSYHSRCLPPCSSSPPPSRSQSARRPPPSSASSSPASRARRPSPSQGARTPAGGGATRAPTSGHRTRCGVSAPA